MDTEMMTDGKRFVWDDEKNRINLSKHGISLRVARFVFNDPKRVRWPDDEHSDEEERYKVIGKVGKIILVVCHDRGDVTRIISARRADKKERMAYNGY